jgi:hypothetical protein
VKAVFVELSPFERYRADYLDDDAFRRLQQLLMVNPEAGALIPGHGWVASDLLLVECRLAVLVIHNLRQR